jgi:hypothetical protein
MPNEYSGYRKITKLEFYKFRPQLIEHHKANGIPFLFNLNIWCRFNMEDLNSHMNNLQIMAQHYKNNNINIDSMDAVLWHK